ncbi:MAG: sporulation protein YqfD [Lachnospiraceae bacterium]
MTGLLHIWHGYLLIRLNGFSPERFLNLCSANGIGLWELCYGAEGYECYITVKEFWKLKPLVRKSGVKIKILKKFGLPFFLYRNRRRKLFAAGVLGFFVMLYLLSLFIWDIQFEGNRKYTDDVLMTFLEEQSIGHGMYKYGISCDAIEEGLRTEFSEITWVSARISGTRLLVQIKENEVLSRIPEKKETPCDLIASKSGVITSMIVRQGVPMVSVGDSVEAGDLLVKGTLEITNDSGEVVNYHQVRSDGDILAETVYDYRKDFPQYHSVAAETGKKKSGGFVQIFGKSVTFLTPRQPDSSWKFVTEEHQLKLFENFYLPVYWGNIQGKEYVSYDRKYTKEEKEILAERLHQEFMENLMEKGVHIIENNVKILESEHKWQMNGHLQTVEPIGTEQAIQPMQLEETKESDEYHRNDN